MVVKCEIEFDQNPTGIFFAGQLVSGTVVLKCDKQKDVKAISLKISGRAEAVWSERRFNSRHIYHGLEDYLSSVTYLLGSEESSNTTIALGVQSFKFTCQLPYNCPTSFEGLHGHIRYIVKVSLERPWKFDQNYKRAFTVLRGTDLNFESPHIRIPTVSEAYKTFCCGPCTTEPLKLVLRLPQAGFVPGQNIPVRGLVINNTKMTLGSVKFDLVMLVRYISQSPMRTNVQRISVSKVKSDVNLRCCNRTFNEEIHVPATPPTTLQDCKIIQIVYQVEMEVKMKSFNRSQVVSIPVIIGTAPLAHNMIGVEVIQQQPSNTGRERRTELNISKEETSPSTIELYPPSCPPPSYEESVHTQRNNINDGEEHTFGFTEFAPLYPVFNVPSPCVEETPIPAEGIDNRSFVS